MKKPFLSLAPLPSLALALILGAPMMAQAQVLQPTAPASGTMQWNGSKWESVGPGSPMSVTSTSAAASSTNISGSVATGGTFQSIAASNTARKGCSIQNTSTGTEYVYFGATGSATLTKSIQLIPGQSLACASGSIVLDDNIAITGATTGQTFAGNVQ